MTSQIVINDPTSARSYVYLKPNQQLKLVLTKNYGLTKFDWDDSFLSKYYHQTDEDKEIIIFQQNEEVVTWPEFSQTYLGEIKLFTTLGFSALGVVLDSQKNPCTMTVINPEGSQVKLRPNHLLEIIVLNHAANDVFEPIIGKGTHGLKYASLSITAPRRKFSVPSKSYIFSLDTKISSIWPSGLYDAGYIILAKKDEPETKYVVFVDLKIKKRRSKIYFSQMDDSYQEINLVPKPFSDIGEGCVTREISWQ